MPPSVAGTEDVGRCVLSIRDARRAREQSVRTPSFLARKGDNKLSADRLSVAPEQKTVRTGERVAQARQDGIILKCGKPSRDVRFEGWNVVEVARAGDLGCEVVASPTEENCYHADIVLPESVRTDEEERWAYAQKLGKVAAWRERRT